MSSFRSSVLTGITALAVGVAVLNAPAAVAGGATPAIGAAAPIASLANARTAAGWLSLQFTGGTRLQSPFSGVYYDDWGLTADGILALDSAGVGQSFASAATSTLAAHLSDYVGSGDESYAGALAKSALVAQAQLLNPASFGGQNLLTELQARQFTGAGANNGRFMDQSDFGDYSNAITQSLAIIVQLRSGRTAAAETAAVDSLETLQCANGGFRLDYAIPAGQSCTSDNDATAYAIQALWAIGGDVEAGDSPVNLAVTYLLAQQDKATGAVNNSSSATANSNTTGLAAVAFATANRAGAAQSAATFLIARQQVSSTAPTALGAINFTTGAYDATTSLRATTQAIPGLVAGQVTSASNAGLFTVSRTGATATAPTSARASGGYVSIAPSRLLDTRTTGTPVAAGGTVSVQITGHAGIPAGASAVSVTVTAVTPSTPGYVTAYASGTPRPGVSNLNLIRGVTVAGTAEIPVGADGKIALVNGSSSSLQLLVDVSGYYLPGTGLAAGTFRAITPSRLLDTRNTAAVPAGGKVSVQVTGAGNVPGVSNVRAIAATVTAVVAGAPGFVLAYPAGSTAPTASTLNLSTGQTVANGALLPIDATGKITLTNNSTEPLNLLLDVSGYYQAGVPQFTGAFVPLTPARALDTRSSTAVAAGDDRALPLLTVAGVPATGVAAVAYNLTAVTPTAAGSVTVFPSGSSLPGSSNLNLNPGRTVANLGITGLGTQGGVNLHNGSPKAVNLVVDVSGYFRS